MSKLQPEQLIKCYAEKHLNEQYNIMTEIFTDVLKFREIDHTFTGGDNLTLQVSVI